LDLLDGGIGRERSQKGSNVTLQWPQTVHCKVDLSWPTNRSTIFESSLLK
jgi:hypothetical protein